MKHGKRAFFGTGIMRPHHRQRTGRVMDMTKTFWGHNFQVISHEDDECEVFVWITPRPKVGDQLKWKTVYGIAVFDVVESTWLANVDDMYRLRLKIAERINE